LYFCLGFMSRTSKKGDYDLVSNLSLDGRNRLSSTRLTFLDRERVIRTDRNKMLQVELGSRHFCKATVSSCPSEDEISFRASRMIPAIILPPF